MAASQVSLPSTPQQNTTYDTYMQSLQQKLSSISMQNAAQLLHVDSSSAPTSGTTTTEMLSPVQEFETSQQQQQQQQQPVPTEISEQPEKSEKPQPQPQEKPLEKEKTRRVSRFKVSVVAEPDPTKLIIKPERERELEREPEPIQEPEVKREDDQQIQIQTQTQEIQIQESLTFINNTMLQLQENVQSSYLSQVKNISATVPAGWTPENNETFEDMLGRQQAELNALIEAHRKQQIEYMKSITVYE